jgi:hypothetical protein
VITCNQLWISIASGYISTENIRMQKVEILISGEIDLNWSNWLGGLEIIHIPGGNTILSGHLRDQAALYGVLLQLSKLGLPLISVWCELNSAGGSKEVSV